MKRHIAHRSPAEYVEQWLQLPDGALTHTPRIEWSGTHRLLVENGCRLCTYEDNCICLSTACGTLQILGAQLYITALSKDSVTISGQIVSVEYIT